MKKFWNFKYVLFVLCCSVLLTACQQNRNGAAETIPYAPVPVESTADTLSVLQRLEEPEVESAPLRVTFLGAGDSIVHEGIWMEARRHAAENGAERAFDFSHLFMGMKELITAADVAFINQETLMAGEAYGYSGYPRFNSPQELSKDILDAGFDVVNIANNHMLDMLPDGLQATIDYWKTQDCTLIGGYESRADYDDIRILEVNDMKIAFLSYCYGTNGLTMPDDYDLVIPYLNEADIRRQTASAAELADVILVSVHWGEDGMQAVTDEQKRYAQLFADCGVDAVIGHHPHLIQPIEWITGEHGNMMLCAYSLGNLYSLMADSRNMVGGFLCFDIVKIDDSVHLENILFRPTVFYYNTGFFGQHLYFIEAYTDEKAASHGTQNYGKTPETPAQLLSYVRTIIKDNFLPPALQQGDLS